MIDLHGVISIPFLKKSRFTGSYKGMRYVLQKAERVVEETQPAEKTQSTGEAQPTEEAQKEVPAKTEPVIRAIIWREPFNYENTPEEQKHNRDFPFDQDGLWDAVAWLNAEHAAGHF